MRRRSIAAIAALVSAGACGDPAGPQDIAGQYVMLECRDENNAQGCAEADSSGAMVTVVTGGLQLGWNTPAGRYLWDLVRMYDYPNGTSWQTQAIFSAGFYTWDGTTLTLVDSTILGRMTGLVKGNRITIESRDRQYQFLKLIQLPH